MAMALSLPFLATGEWPDIGQALFGGDDAAGEEVLEEPAEKTLYAALTAMTSGEGVSVSKAKLAEILGVSPQHIRRLLKSMENHGILRAEWDDRRKGDNATVEFVSKPIRVVNHTEHTGSVQNRTEHTGSDTEHTGSVATSPYNDKLYNNSSSSLNTSSKKNTKHEIDTCRSTPSTQDIMDVYNAYPARCPVSGRSNQRGAKAKEKIKNWV